MSEQGGFRLRAVLTVSGVLAIALGAVAPWIRPNPALVGRTDSIPDVLLPKMNAGLELYGVFLLAPALLLASIALGASRGDARYRRRDWHWHWYRYQSLAVRAYGLIGLVLAGYYIRSHSLVGFDGTFVPATGWYLVVAGSSVLLLRGDGVSRNRKSARRDQLRSHVDGDSNSDSSPNPD
ncbi:hypothetical protein C482_09567 [Natrialba chahannaoensis JCM 10990]|uniref:Uncharacterized protein n=1 Tax=Natrialba chahannaoensis JCM 10990 TaxID=1227492 RepID=M0AQR0_9EURY|nr:hypothetical protein [Natrialba chahannaoensis]ELY99723.1 hypothetical protein C482_09567 [Natrialba chahannaoensis JCM 10990]